MANTPLNKVRVLIVDDSTFMRKVLETILISDPQLQVIGHAKDGREAIALAESLKPDVISMDINMPHMDGLQATFQIITINSRPIVVVCSESKDGGACTLKALELGAIEFIAKPNSAIDRDMQSIREDLLRKVKMAAKVRVVRTASRLAAALQSTPQNGAPPITRPAPVVSRPSSSVADQRFPGVVLTGMGADGAQGAKAIKKAGGHVIAQDEATSVIFGMPAEAIKLRAVDQVLGLDDIYSAIEKRVIALARATPVGVR